MNRWRRGTSILLALWVSTLVLAACQSGSVNVLHIYTSFPMRGPRIGSGIVKGIQLAFDEIDSQIGKYQIVLIVLDDGDELGQWNGDVETANVQRAVDDPAAVAYIGPMNSGAAQLSIPITNRAGMAQISPSTTWPGLTKEGFAQGQPGIFYPTGKRTFFRTCPTDDMQGPAGALWAKDLGFNSFYVLDDGEAYGAGIATLFARRAEQIGLVNKGRQTIDKTATDFTAVLQQVKKAQPDMVYFGGTVATGGGLILKQLRAMGLKAAFMGPDALVDSTIFQTDEAGEAAEGMYATFVGSPPSTLDTPAGKKFYEDFKAKYGEEPEAYAQYGYDAARVVIAAIQQAKQVDRADVLTGVAATHDFVGASGTFSFNVSGDTSLTTVSGNVAHDGAFEFAKVLNVLP
jgi:branched-chain amino acid transport system substrate-binding protein